MQFAQLTKEPTTMRQYTNNTTPTSNSEQPPIQPAPSTASLAYSMDDADVFPPPPAYQLQRSERINDATGNKQGSFATTEDSIDQSLCSEMSYDYASFQGYSYQSVEQPDEAPKENIYSRDATETVHRMHRALLQLLSSPEMFHEALEWEELVERGVEDPAAFLRGDKESKTHSNGKLNEQYMTLITLFLGIKSFESEFEDDTETSAASEHKQADKSDNSTKDLKHSADEDFSNALPGNTPKANKVEEEKNYTPLAHQIFASDAEVVLPQALTASQLFGIERVTGIELEAAAGISGLCHLFLRWLALMPEGDHMNVIDPPGLTVMRIAGGRYRVTGAHRVVWRWMNSFSPASALLKPSSDATATDTINEEGDSPDTDFDFGDLVTMTIIDVFETDSDGKLLSYCPTFDNRAVHKTQEVTERIRKGASNLMERMVVAKRSPAGKTVNRAAGNFGKMAISVGSLVRHRIEEEITKRKDASGAAADDNSGENLGNNDDLASQTDLSKEEQSKTANESEKAVPAVTTPPPNRRMEV